MIARPDFVAGNTRLRARLPVLRALAVEVGDPEERVREAMQLLRAVPGAYEGPAQDSVAVLLARHDLRDALALVRGALRSYRPRERLRGVAAVGAVTATAASDVAQAEDAAATVLRLAAHKLPDPGVAVELGRLWAAFELHDDIDEFETGLVTAAHSSWARRLQRGGRGAAPVQDLLDEERDLANLGAVLRGAPKAAMQLLPPGSVPDAALAAAAAGDWRTVIRARPEWRGAIRAATGQDTRSDSLGDSDRGVPDPLPVRLERALRSGLRHRRSTWLRSGDVFTAEPAVAFVLAAEATVEGRQDGSLRAGPIAVGA